jgi:uncharacterized protein
MEKRHVSSHIDFVELPARNVADLARTKEFFGRAFGWTFQDYGPDYADITNSGLGSGINADPEHRPAHPLVVIYASKLEAVRDRVLEAGAKVTREIFAFPGGRRFHFTDPSGNELAVWSDEV